MEKAGTGGALFRNLYRDFLGESYDLLSDSSVAEAHVLFAKSARSWTEVATLPGKAGRSNRHEYINEACELRNMIALTEARAMTLLLEV